LFGIAGKDSQLLIRLDSSGHMLTENYDMIAGGVSCRRRFILLPKL